MWLKSFTNLLNYRVVLVRPICKERLSLERVSTVEGGRQSLKTRTVNCESKLSHGSDTNVHERLKTLFGFSDKEAKKFRSENPFLSMNHLNNYEIYGNGINPSVICQNPWIINCSLHKSRSNLKYLSEMGVSSATLCVAKIGLGTELRGPRTSNLRERIDFFVISLQCHEEDVLKMFERHRSLVTMDLDRLRRILDLLTEHGVAKEYIRADLWTFRRNEDKMRQRLEAAQSVNLTPIKPWMLRCNESYFQSIIRKKTESDDILGEHKDLIGYFADRLCCSEDDVRKMTERFEGILAVNVPKVKQMFDALLLEFRFTSDQIQQFPFVFDHKVDTLRYRYTQLSESGCSPIHLHYLCVNNNQFKQLMKKIKRNYN